MKFTPVGDSELFCTCLTRTKDYDAFCAATGRQHDTPDFEQTEDDPVVDVNWSDAEAFCQWLTKKERDEKILEENQSYRLPKDKEWSFAAGLPDEGGDSPAQRDGRIKDVYPWGKAWPPPAGAGNYADYSSRKLHVTIIDGYEDGFCADVAGGKFPEEPSRPFRHGRKRMGMGGGPLQAGGEMGGAAGRFVGKQQQGRVAIVLPQCGRSDAIKAM